MDWLTCIYISVYCTYEMDQFYCKTMMNRLICQIWTSLLWSHCVIQHYKWNFNIWFSIHLFWIVNWAVCLRANENEEMVENKSWEKPYSMRKSNLFPILMIMMTAEYVIHICVCVRLKIKGLSYHPDNLSAWNNMWCIGGIWWLWDVCFVCISHSMHNKFILILSTNIGCDFIDCMICARDQQYIIRAVLNIYIC